MPQLEKSPCSSEDPTWPKINKIMVKLLKYDTNELIYKTETFTGVENRLVGKGGEGGVVD